MHYLPGFDYFYRSLQGKRYAAQNLWKVASTQHTQGFRTEGFRSNFSPVPLVIGVASEPGCRDQQNTDSYGVFNTYATVPDGATGEMISVAVVASSLGTRSPHPWASPLVVESIHDALSRHEHRPIQQILVEAIRQVNQTIYQQADPDLHLSGMGAMTVVAAILYHTLYLAYVGDCRAYLIRKDAIHRLTVPPRWSPIANLPTNLMFGTRRTALLPPHFSRVLDPTQVLGRTDLVEVSTTILPLASELQPAHSGALMQPTYQLRLQANDILLLCTPGLHRIVSEEEMARTVTHYPLHEAASRLAVMATQAQASDSHTVLLMQQPHSPPSRNWRTMALGLPVVTCLLLLVIGWFALPISGDHLAKVVRSLSAGLVYTLQGEPSLPIIEAEEQPRAGAPQNLPLPTLSAVATPASMLTAPPRINRPATPIVEPAMGASAPIAGLSNDWQPVAGAVRQIFAHLALTTTLPTFPQRARDTLAAVGEAVVAARTATAVAALPLPTLTPTAPPTLPPPTLPSPTLVPNRSLTPPRPSPTPTAQARSTPTRPGFANMTVALLEPAEFDTLRDKRPFRWKANALLPPGYAFEVVFWQRGQDPLKQGRGYAGVSAEERVNASYEHFRLHDGPEGEYRWGVLLIITDPYQRVKYLGGDRVIYVKRE